MYRRKKLLLWALPVAVLLITWLCCLPGDLFRGVAYATVVEDRSGELLGARISSDGQWRFPPCDTVPERYARALVRFEDRRFQWHPGVDPAAVARALRDNVRSGHTVSGGSTITMQVIRLSRTARGRSSGRNLWEKAVEAFMAVRLEFRCTKREIMALYASHAPFGGNVVGIDAAAWRYFGRPAGELSWGETALLAVLPNSPSSMHPGRNRDGLLGKRNRLLRDLLDHGDITPEVYSSAVEEPLPDEPLPLPHYCEALVERCPAGERVRTTIDLSLQRKVAAYCDSHSDELAASGIADLAAVVIDNASGEVRCYVGNSSPGRARPGAMVDIAASPRSTGSILKPFLYCAALQDGIILPRTLLPDVPVNLGGFAPQNYDRKFYGAVPAGEALARSLNVPAVWLLREYGVARLLEVLRGCGLSTLSRPAAEYGLSLILGGGEATLEDLVQAYSALVREVCDAAGPSGSGGTSLVGGLSTAGTTFPLRDRAAILYTLKALEDVSRPDEMDRELLPSLRRCAWKTGTSYGFRDAWAVGMTPQWTIGVWAGNADGTGVPALTGASVAGPAMFSILNLLPETSPGTGASEAPGGSVFPDPADDWSGVLARVCKDSGRLAGPDCPASEETIPSGGLNSEPCPYHSTGSFVLPPAMEWYYRPGHPEYQGAPSTAPGLAGSPMSFIYPSTQGSVLRLPRQLSGEPGKAVFRVAHRDPDATLWWHLDGEYLGETSLRHEMALAPSPGSHTLTVVDPSGASASVRFQIL